MRYNKEDKKLLTKVYYDYIDFRHTINVLVKNGKNMQELYDYVLVNVDCDITNCEFLDDFKYIDINFKDMTISILQHNNDTIYVGSTIEVWNDKKYEYLGDIDFKDLEKLVLESE